MLLDPGSPYVGRISDVVLLLSKDPKDREAAEKTKAILGEHRPEISVEFKYWSHDNPIDHGAIFSFLRERLPQIRRAFPNRELVINVSPGTPAMHTVWMLMAETGFIEEPFSIWQTLREEDRKGRPVAVPAQVGIETYYKAYQKSQPRQVAAEEERFFWDPKKFRSERLKSVFDEARRFAALKVPVMILGERGTGKTTLAGWIRQYSDYRKPELDDAWPSVPCGQYSPETMRSELFGYMKGAFTGAEADTKGLLHKADGDTLFLDEIGDISRDLQRLLIRAVENKQFYRVGAQVPEESDFRLITATNRSLDELAECLDRDFFDRIGAFILQMPALREIREDLPWLWEDIYRSAADRAVLNPAAPMLSPEDHAFIVDGLQHHDLPGNLRDLYRVAYHLAAALQDRESPFSARAACEYALQKGLSVPGGPGEAQPRRVAGAYAADKPLDAALRPDERLVTDDLFKDLKRYLANEVKRLADVRGEKPEDVWDMSKRTFYDWLKEN